jgi:hypothetical protein
MKGGTANFTKRLALHGALKGGSMCRQIVPINFLEFMGVPFAVDIHLILIFVASSMEMLHEIFTSNE